MRDAAGRMGPEDGRFRGRLRWAVVLGILLGLALGCTLQGPRLGSGPEPDPGFRWAAADPSRLLRTAHYFQRLGQPELGARELEAAHRLDPGNLGVADALAQYYQELGLGDRALQVYRETLALAPDNPALQNNLCFSYYQAGDFSRAEACFRQTLARQPDNRAARNNLGLVLCRLGRRGPGGPGPGRRPPACPGGPAPFPGPAGPAGCPRPPAPRNSSRACRRRLSFCPGCLPHHQPAGCRRRPHPGPGRGPGPRGAPAASE
jgi:tetratricopeptide (TPR) repeat protein